MSGLTISEIRTALAEQIRNNIERDTNVYAHPQGDYQYPAITVDFAPDYLDYWETFGPNGIAAVRFVLRIEPAGTLLESSAIALDDYLSCGTGNGSSVIDAVMSDVTLGLTGCNVHITGVTVDPVTATAELAVEVNINKVGANA